MRRFGWLILAAAAAACGSASGGGGGTTQPTEIDGVQVMPGFDPGVAAPASSDGFQVISPIITDIPPGASWEECTWTNLTMPQTVHVNAGFAHQSEGGHHVIVYYTLVKQPAGTTRICTDADMANMRYSMIGGAQGDTKESLPGNLAVTIPAGAQIVINHHYVNATAKALPQAQSALTVYYDKDPNFTPAGAFVVLNTSMSVKPGLSAIDVYGTLNHDYQAFVFLPHAHQYASHVTIDHTSGTTTNRLFDTDWTPEYMFHAPEQNFTLDKPYQFHTGDQIHVHCDYNNTTSSPLTFGAEMCLFYAATVDANNWGDQACDNGSWGTF